MEYYLSPEYILPQEGEVILALTRNNHGIVEKGTKKMIYYQNEFVDLKMQVYERSRIYKWKPTAKFQHPYKQAKQILTKIINKDKN